MVRSLGVDLRKIYEHASFTANRYLSSYVVAIIVSNLLLAVFLIIFGAGQTFSLWLYGPLFIAIIIYKIFSSIQASRAGREISSGEAELYLAHTLKRTEYLASTFLVVVFLPALVLLSTFLMIVITVAPKALSSSTLYLQLIYILAELSVHGTFVLFLAISGREGFASFLGTMLAFFVPLFLSILVSIIYYGNLPPQYYQAMYTVTWIFSFLSPYTYNYYYLMYTQSTIPMPGQNPLPSPWEILTSSIFFLLFLWGLIFLRFKRKDL